MSALLFAAAGTLWVRSYWTTDYVWRQRNPDSIEFVSSNGEVLVTTQHLGFPAGPDQSLPGWNHRSADTWPLTIDTIIFAPFGAPKGFTARVPIVGVAAPLVVFPGLWTLVKYRERSRRRRGLCLSCGYDLRASPDRCPECGRPAK
jgi:hypothetical protein